MVLNFREAHIEDIEQLHVIRLSVKENRLSNPNLIQYKDYEKFLINRGKGWVCVIKDSIVGFAVVDMMDYNVWALFVDPEFEGRGIGRKLHDIMLDWYFAQTRTTIWLGTAPGTRAAEFYRRAGWTETGVHGKGEIKFEMMWQKWINHE